MIIARRLIDWPRWVSIEVPLALNSLATAISVVLREHFQCRRGAKEESDALGVKDAVLGEDILEVAILVDAGVPRPLATEEFGRVYTTVERAGGPSTQYDITLILRGRGHQG